MIEPLPAAYRAAWIFPVAEPPIADAILEVDERGRISGIRRGKDRDAFDLGDVAIVPLLVNAHVHLEFSDLSQPIGPQRPFTDWIRQVVSHRRSRVQPVADLLDAGLREIRDSGTVAVGEIATSDETEAYGQSDTEVVAFRELIGPRRQEWPRLLTELENYLTAPAPPNVRPAISPHAPYTVPEDLFEESVQLGVKHGAPIAVHLAETSAERELFSSGSGELVDMMRSLGLWEPFANPLGRSPLDWIRTLAAADRGLVIHGNYLNRDELDEIASHSNLTLVYCPRSHAYFGHPPHPFSWLLAAGGRVALGTDGRSSNPDLDLWHEAACLRERHPDISSDTILELATKSGAEALGLAHSHGSLVRGRPANFLAVELAGLSRRVAPDLFGSDRLNHSIFKNGIPQSRHSRGDNQPHVERRSAQPD